MPMLRRLRSEVRPMTAPTERPDPDKLRRVMRAEVGPSPWLVALAIGALFLIAGALALTSSAP